MEIYTEEAMINLLVKIGTDILKINGNTYWGSHD
jgi:hypothetical protein